MKPKYLICFLLFTACLQPTHAFTMYDSNGMYTDVSPSMARYSHNTAASSAASYYNTRNSASIQTMPYRYNTLNYTKIRRTEHNRDYSMKCRDIGDASFCQ